MFTQANVAIGQRVTESTSRTLILKPGTFKNIKINNVDLVK